MAAPTTPVLDDFNRVNADPASGFWALAQAAGSAHKIVSNALAPQNLGSDNLSYYTARTYGPSCEAYTTVPTLPSGGDRFGVGVRWTNDSPTTSPPTDTSSNGYIVMCDNAGTLGLRRYNAGSIGLATGGTVLTTGSTSISAGDKLCLRAIGSGTVYLEVWVYHSAAWSRVISYVDTSGLSNPGWFLIWNEGAVVTFNDFGGGDLEQTGLSAGFDLGTNGATIATTDTGDETAWNVVTIAAGATLTYDNTRSVSPGSQSAKIFSNADTTRTEWTTAFGSRTNWYGRMYLYFTADPSPFDLRPVDIFELGGARSCAFIFVKPASTTVLRILNSPSATVATGTVAIPLNQWFRIEWHLINNSVTGSIDVKLFTDADSTTPAETLSSGSTNTGDLTSRIMLGDNLGSTLTWWMDEIIAGAVDWPGPSFMPKSLQPDFARTDRMPMMVVANTRRTN